MPEGLFWGVWIFGAHPKIWKKICKSPKSLRVGSKSLRDCRSPFEVLGRKVRTRIEVNDEDEEDEEEEGGGGVQGIVLVTARKVGGRWVQ